MPDIFRMVKRTKFKLGTTGRRRWPTSRTGVVSSKVKPQGHKVTWPVWRVSVHNSRTESRRNTKIGRKVPHDKRNIAHQFQGQKVKDQGYRRSSSHTQNAWYSPNRKAYEIQTSCIGGAQSHASPATAMTSKVKGQGHKVTWSVWPVRPITREWIVVEISKLVGSFSTTRAMFRTSFKVKKVKAQGHRSIYSHTQNTSYLPNGKAYELQTSYAGRGQSPASLATTMTSKIKGQGHKVTWCVWPVRPITRERIVVE